MSKSSFDHEAFDRTWAEGMITRRRALAVGGSAFAAFVAGCGSNSGGSASSTGAGKSAGSKTITWASQEAYANKKSLAGFPSDKLNVQLFPSASEALAKLTTGDSGIDVLIDFTGHGLISYQSGLIAPIDLAKVPNYNDVLPTLRKQADNTAIFEGKPYGTFQDWGTDSVAYIHDDGLGREVTSIATLFDKSLKGKIGMPANYFESIYVGAIYLGYNNPSSLSDDQLKKVVDVLKAQKPLVRTYWDNIGNLKNQFASGEVQVAWAWSPVLQLADESDVDIRWAVPKEGQLLWYNVNYLTKEAVKRGNEDAAHEFMNYAMSPAYFVPLATQYQYRPSSQKAIAELSPKLRKKLALDDPGFLANAKAFSAPTNPKAYQAAWDQVTNA